MEADGWSRSDLPNRRQEEHLGEYTRQDNDKKWLSRTAQAGQRELEKGWYVGVRSVSWGTTSRLEVYQLNRGH